MSNHKKKILITGGAGFIGGTLIRKLLNESNYHIFNIDKLGYASDISGILNIESSKIRHSFFKADIKDKNLLDNLFEKIDPDIVINFAAESHVDRSLDNPSNFIESNILGTFNLLECSRNHWNNLSKERQSFFKFHHISTDEVYGSLGVKGEFNEKTRYDPRSPYSASKASSDHLVNSWHHSFGLPTLITNCSNNYGPYQFPEKLIPLTIIKALRGEKIPLYGDGSNKRDWLFVEDHIDAILLVAEKAKSGSNYCIGGFGEKSNKDVVIEICNLMDKYNPKSFPHSKLIENVKDRPGHDQRYAINSKLIQTELGWMPRTEFKSGLKRTVEWYLKNIKWVNYVMKKSGYLGGRLGT